MALHHCSRTSLLPTAAIAPCALSTNLAKPATSVTTGKPKDSCNAGQRSSTNKTCCQSPDNKADSATALPCPPAPNINNVFVINSKPNPKTLPDTRLLFCAWHLQ